MSYRQHRYEAHGYFPRPRLHRPRAYGAYGYGYGYRPRYRALPAFAGPAYYPYSHGVSHGYRRVGYGYPAYPISSYGTIAGGSLYAPLYNRPAFTCY